MSEQLKYFYKEDKNLVLVSSSATDASGLNALLTSSKTNVSFNTNFVSKISSLGVNSSYLTPDGFNIPIGDDQELYVYRGYSTGDGDNNNYKYNPFLHRPYKLYFLTSTGSLAEGGIPIEGYRVLNSNRSESVHAADLGVSDPFVDITLMEEVGLMDPNETYSTSFSASAVSGSFEIINEHRQVYPWIRTNYTRLADGIERGLVISEVFPPLQGALFAISKSNGDPVGAVFQSWDGFSQTSNGLQPAVFDNGVSLTTSPSDMEFGINLSKGTYIYTSSIFDFLGQNEGFSPSTTHKAYGTTQFGLLTNLDEMPRFTFTVDQTNSQPMTVEAVSVTLERKLYTINQGEQINFRAQPGSITASGNDHADDFIIGVQDRIGKISKTGNTFQIYNQQITDVYVSFSESLANSIDGLYVFNQVPTQDISITASIEVDAWTGSVSGSGFKYGETGSDYATASYGEGEEGGSQTWPFATINLYTGSFPSNVPTTSSTPYITRRFDVSTGVPSTIAISGSVGFGNLNIGDCLSLSLSVDSGSEASTFVQNSLVARNYHLEINNVVANSADSLLPTFINNAFSASVDFLRAADCQPILNNVNVERENPFIQIVDYSFGIYNPINSLAIKNNTAVKSTVPNSYYTSIRHTIPRYDGSKTTSNALNSISGLRGGFGKLPPITYERAFFGYADKVSDPYPILNNKSQFNLKYLIGENSEVRQPNLSEYTAFDVEGTWDEGGIGQVSLNAISESNQFLTLEGNQTIYKVGKKVSPILYSQNSSIGFTTTMSLNNVSAPTSNFTNYGLSARGETIPPVSNNNLDDIVGIVGTTQSVELFDDTVASALVSTGSLSGSIAFRYDTLTTDSTLSDDYKLQLTYTQPTSRPRRRAKAGSFNNKFEIATIKVSLARYLNGVFDRNEPIEFTDDVKLQYYTTTNNGIGNLSDIIGGNRVFINNNNEIFLDINSEEIREFIVDDQGVADYTNVMYVNYIINAQNTSPLFSLDNGAASLNEGYYYQWVVTGSMVNETNAIGNVNFFNPTYYLGASSNDQTPIPSPPNSSVNLLIAGDKEAASPNLTSSYWDLVTPSTSGSNTIELLSSIGNNFYNKGRFQQTVEYQPASSSVFPGGLEPFDTAFPQDKVSWNVEVDDEIRFENNEDLSFKVLNVITPEENPNGRLQLIVDRVIPTTTNLNFFLLRRFTDSPGTLLIDKEFPYSEILPSGSTQLSKNQQTTTGIIFPEFPIEEIQDTPDSILQTLRDKKLIE
jgi:hypothetical protein